MSQDHTTFPHIHRATLVMAASNGVTEGEKSDIVRRLDKLLATRDIIALKRADDWISTLVHDQLDHLVDGDVDGEMWDVLDTAPDPKFVETLMQDIFERVIA